MYVYGCRQCRPFYSLNKVYNCSLKASYSKIHQILNRAWKEVHIKIFCLPELDMAIKLISLLSGPVRSD